MILRALLLALVLVTGCSPSAPVTGTGDIELASALRSFDDCPELTEQVRGHLLERLEEHGGTPGWAPVPQPLARDVELDSLAGAESAAGAAADTARMSTTNVQEAGIDEADVAKTDGSFLYSVVDGVLRVVDITGDAPEVVATRRLGDAFPREMLLLDDRLLIMGDAPVPPPEEPVPLPRPEPAPLPEPTPPRDEPVPDRTPTPDRTATPDEPAPERPSVPADVDPAPPVDPGPSGAEVVPPEAGPARPDVPGLRMVVPWNPRTRLWLVDVATPQDPRVLSTMTLDGALVASRMTGDIARVVVHSGLFVPGMVEPSGGHPDGQRRALTINRERVEQSSATDWLPGAEVDGGDRQPLVACDAVHAPRELGDTGMVTVLSVDMDGAELSPERTEAVLGAAENVYATDEHLYVSTGRWPVALPVEPLPIEPGPGPGPVVPDMPADTPSADDAASAEAERRARATERADVLPEPPEITTEIHRFDLDGPEVTYAASGSVPGMLLNQWALSEHDGVLRVATTEDETFDGQRSHSSVRILEERDGELVEIGRVGDLGRGERIHAVRYAGDIGFVVTFRQTDPLYTLNLSDPENPRVLGELKIPGYSAYLHPIGDDHVLGVGQDADAQGRTKGVQVSLFDVSDLTAPRRVDQYAFGQGTMTSVEFDHRAFLYWPDEDLVVLPLENWSLGQVGAAVLTVTPADGVRERGLLEHRGPEGVPPPVQRAFVVDGRLVTVSSLSVQIADLDSLQVLGETRFGG